MALVQPERTTVRAKGSSETADLALLFPKSPRFDGYTNNEVLTEMKGLTNGQAGLGQNPEFPAVDLDYDPGAQGGAPDIATVAPLDGSPLNSPWSPALGSPGPGSFDPLANAPGPAGLGHSSRNGSTTSPHETSTLISQQAETADVVPGNLKRGESF